MLKKHNLLTLVVREQKSINIQTRLHQSEFTQVVAHGSTQIKQHLASKPASQRQEQNMRRDYLAQMQSPAVAAAQVIDA